jgi:membrane protease YdiL (CAAX protease family)
MPSRSKTFEQPGTGEGRSLPAQEQHSFVPGPITALVELAVAYGFIEAAEWTETTVKLVLSLIAAAWILFCVFRRRPSVRAVGLSFPSFRSMLVTIGSAAVLSLTILIGGWLAGTWDPRHPTWPPLQNPDLYAVWALLQQFMLQVFFYLRVESIVRSSRLAVVVTALLFAIAHVPNPFLMVATLIGGLFFCECFRRYRNLYPLAVAHALLGYALAESLSMILMRHMRVGIGYIHSR